MVYFRFSLLLFLQCTWKLCCAVLIWPLDLHDNLSAPLVLPERIYGIYHLGLYQIVY